MTLANLISSEDLTITEAWKSVGGEIDVSASKNAVFWIEITKNGCKGIEVRACSSHTVGGTVYEFVPRVDGDDADQAEVLFKRLKEDTAKIGFQLHSLEAVSGITMQARCVNECEDNAVINEAFLSHE